MIEKVIENYKCTDIVKKEKIIDLSREEHLDKLKRENLDNLIIAITVIIVTYLVCRIWY